MPAAADASPYRSVKIEGSAILASDRQRRQKRSRTFGPPLLQIDQLGSSTVAAWLGACMRSTFLIRWLARVSPFVRSSVLLVVLLLMIGWVAAAHPYGNSAHAERGAPGSTRGPWPASGRSAARAPGRTHPGQPLVVRSLWWRGARQLRLVQRRPAPTARRARAGLPTPPMVGSWSYTGRCTPSRWPTARRVPLPAGSPARDLAHPPRGAGCAPFSTGRAGGAGTTGRMQCGTIGLILHLVRRSDFTGSFFGPTADGIMMAAEPNEVTQRGHRLPGRDRGGRPARRRPGRRASARATTSSIRRPARGVHLKPIRVGAFGSFRPCQLPGAALQQPLRSSESSQPVGAGFRAFRSWSTTGSEPPRRERRRCGRGAVAGQLLERPG